MSTAYLSWEEQLLHKARVAFMPHSAHTQSHDQEVLRQAYQHAEQIIHCHSRTFHMASALLPKPQRRAARVLYAFCRISDNIVDRGLGDRLKMLENWKRASLSDHPTMDHPVPIAWADTRHRFHIPRHYAEQLLDGVALDLTKTRYTTFDELAHYCYGVASTVGLMTMHIVGFESEAAIPYAIKLGVALQLTNILRDVGEDWANGRIYLPQEELALFGLCEADIATGTVDERWRAFMQFQIARARQLYEEAMPGVAMLGKSGRFAIAAAAELYRGILADIEAHDYNVFTRRAHLTTSQKLRLLPGIWWRTKNL
ncbi:MAG: phytoene/squalene synthase family protein [Anaerolineales bacterium]